MIHEAGMHLVQKMSASKKAEFLEALKDLKGGERMTSFLTALLLHVTWMGIVVAYSLHIAATSL